MSKVRRNAPCPCGSGRKYKHCCLAHEERRAAADREDERVWRRIQDWARERHPDEVGHAIDTYAGPAKEIREEEIDLVCTWVHIDREDGGGSFADRYSRRAELDAREREVARRIAGARLGLYRVLAAEPGAAIELESVTRKHRVQVRSGNVSRHAVRWDLLLGRVIEGDGEHALWGPAAFYDPNEEPELIEQLTRLAAELDVPADADGFDAVFRLRALELLRFVPQSRSIEPEFVSAEGNPAAHATATWAIDDEYEALEALETPPELIWMGPEPDRDTFVWTLPVREAMRGRHRLSRGAIVLEASPLGPDGEPPPGLEGRVEVGSFEVKRGELSFTALSETRLDAACELVKRRLGDAARLLRREVTSLDAASVESRAKQVGPPTPPPAPLPEPEVSDLVQAQLERHYRRMLDEPQTRLGGLTPREAAGSPEHREELVLLVRGIENGAERRQREGEAFPDLGWMRVELGLDERAFAA